MLEKPMSHPEVRPSATTVDRFWKKVAELTTRYHDQNNRWKGTEELQQWNVRHKKACRRCINSKAKKPCVIDIDHPSCRSCRDNKVSCDRKASFVYDTTKEDFFPDFKQFLSVFHDRDAGFIRKIRKHEQKYTCRVKFETDGLIRPAEQINPVEHTGAGDLLPYHHAMHKLGCLH
ncbi:hypothetical protein C8R43DRAFT_955507 [Mycena crocata]|nr:hypothetical protein C8R43DRAFT_955507 [Mycena crocata]